MNDNVDRSVLPVWCVLEGSGKWPEDKDAVQRIKAAFHIKLGQLLSNQLKLTNCVYPDHVDVLKVLLQNNQFCYWCFCVMCPRCVLDPVVSCLLCLLCTILIMLNKLPTFHG